MKKYSFFCIRSLLFIFSIALMTTYTVGAARYPSPLNWIFGLLLGAGFGIGLLILDHFMRGLNLRLFNATILGLFVGYLLTLAMLLFFDTLLRLPSFQLKTETVSLLKIIILLAGSFLGVMSTVRAGEEFYCTIPFVRFTSKEAKSQKLILDISALSDGRVIDLAASGLIDHRVIIPRFLINELLDQENSPDEMQRHKARSALAAIKRLEDLPSLQMHYHDLDFPEEQETAKKIFRLARLLDGDLLTADQNLASQEMSGEVRIINMHNLSKALKPVQQRGEFLNIKIQRQGKELRQGVGYLEDGTMVVVNGGGDFIGDMVKSRVLSVKHSSSGRMIFCNVADYEEENI